MKNLNISKYFIIIFVLSLFSIPIFSINANAGVYPDRPISIAACYPPGGGVDRNLRMVERVASKYLDQSLLPQYVTGGSGTVAMQYITAADPDGYDLAICDCASVDPSNAASRKRRVAMGREGVTPCPFR